MAAEMTEVPQNGSYDKPASPAASPRPADHEAQVIM